MSNKENLTHRRNFEIRKIIRKPSENETFKHQNSQIFHADACVRRLAGNPESNENDS